MAKIASFQRFRVTAISGMLYPPYAIHEDKEFIEDALRLRMLISPYSVDLDMGQSIHCQCGATVYLKADYLHLLEGVHGFASQRHAKECQLLDKRLKHAVGNA
jgi:hypothetical protein